VVSYKNSYFTMSNLLNLWLPGHRRPMFANLV